ncbi:MAG: hypothetical protein GY714_04365 [Desulfobacterales bacterium]|nr:hypothetical protein [Desulfobacterales bacterium]
MKYISKNTGFRNNVGKGLSIKTYDILILSNMNWHIYSNKERHVFASLILALALTYPNLKIKWRPHSSEKKNIAYKNISPLFKKLENIDIQEYNHKIISDVCIDISKTKFAISTISPTIADLYINNIPTVIYKPSSIFDGFSESIKWSTFENKKELFSFFYNTNLIKIPMINKFKRCDDNAFIKLLSNSKNKKESMFDPLIADQYLKLSNADIESKLIEVKKKASANYIKNNILEISNKIGHKKTIYNVQAQKKNSFNRKFRFNRKLEKLKKTPILFLKDAIKNRLS